DQVHQLPTLGARQKRRVEKHVSGAVLCGELEILAGRLIELSETRSHGRSFSCPVGIVAAGAKTGLGRRILGGDSARAALLRGIDLMADLLRPTLGPLPRTVAITRLVGNEPPEMLDSGATIARRTIQLADPFEDMGGMLVRHLAWRVFERVGDGSTTAAVRAQSLVRAGGAYIAAGGNPVAVRRGIECG